ncbi:thioredoxin family protein [Pseudomonas bharatica]|nr:thioredoxin domain-containing protein [Pseudomonas bharatica]
MSDNDYELRMLKVMESITNFFGPGHSKPQEKVYEHQKSCVKSITLHIGNHSWYLLKLDSKSVIGKVFSDAGPDITPTGLKYDVVWAAGAHSMNEEVRLQLNYELKKGNSSPEVDSPIRIAIEIADGPDGMPFNVTWSGPDTNALYERGLELTHTTLVEGSHWVVGVNLTQEGFPEHSAKPVGARPAAIVDWVPGGVTTLTDDNLPEAIKSSTPVLIDFWTEWCGPCKALEKTLRELSPQYGGNLRVARVNTDENSASGSKFHITSVPVMKLFKNGEELETIPGNQPESRIKEILSRHM